MKENFLKRITSKPPILFPMVALFHVGLLLYNIYTFADEPLWTQMFWLLFFTISWIFVCDMKQWAAMVYIGLTTLNLMLRFFLKSEISLSNYTDTLFPADVLFTFFLMFYFKRFD